MKKNKILLVILLLVICGVYFCVTIAIRKHAISGDIESNKSSVKATEVNTKNLKIQNKQKTVVGGSAPKKIVDEKVISELPQPTLSELSRENKNLQVILQGESDGTKYKDINDVNALSELMEEFRFKKRLPIGKERGDLLKSIIRLTMLGGNDGAEASLLLGEYYRTTRDYEQAIQTYKNIMDSSDNIDDGIRADAILRLAIYDYMKPFGVLLSSKMKHSFVYPNKYARDASKLLFEKLKSDYGDYNAEFGISVADIANSFLKMIGTTDARRAQEIQYKIETIEAFKANLLISRIAYSIGTNNKNKFMVPAIKYAKTDGFKEELRDMSTEEQQAWGGYTAWAMHKLHEYSYIVEELPQLQTNNWYDDWTYYNVQYYIAYSYSALGDTSAAKSIVDEILTTCAGDVKKLPPEVREFVRTVSRSKSN